MIFRQLFNIALPTRCAFCQAISGETICQGCQEDFLRTPTQVCRRCALFLANADLSSICGDCLQHSPSYDITIAACKYQAPCDQLVQKLKFRSELGLASAMAQAIRNRILESSQLELPDLLLPVPLGQRRLQERGFNQALEIGRQLSTQLGIPLETRLLRRIKETLAQSTLRPHQRQTNIRNAFLFNDQRNTQIQGLHIGVVDDVMTTGMTLNAIAKELKLHGAVKVSNFVFARTPKSI